MKNDGWIPMDKEPPKENGRYLVTVKSFGRRIEIILNYATNLYDRDKYDFRDKKGKSGWYDFDHDIGYYECDNVIAWRELPPLYNDN